ncbi:sensor domain-containing diguanylate cyclase [Qipengyuania qiaonensis]|nr:diguanylate cyclase [Qipengyuania qiaonensis]
MPVSALAAPAFEEGSTCWISGTRTQQFEELVTRPDDWTCAGDEHDWSADRNFVRVDLRGRNFDSATIRHAEFARHEFDKLTVTLIGEDGATSSRAYGFRDTWLGASSLRSMVELPEFAGQPTALVFTLDGGKWPDALAAADLVAEPSAPPTSGFVHLVAALICGLLLAPVLFDFGYFRALRKPFPLWHALFCVMACVQTAAVSGLVPLMTSISFENELYITYLSLDLMVAATMLFASSFIERASTSSRQRRILLAIAPLAVLNGAATALYPQLFGYWVDHLYFGAYILMLGAYFAILWRARRAGSRMASYLILGFAPFSLVVVVQFLAVVSAPEVYAFDETWPQNLALLFEVIATALAVADRFISIKRERDQALDEARSLEKLSEHDELTGLRNRRSLDTRFGQLVAEGFHTIAVIDIDHFKPINDLFGHPYGDGVLTCVAAALRASDDQDLVAFRIGGEEFLLMLRGKDAAERAEARRRAITVRTLADIDGLDRPVTASMGLLDFSAVADDPELDFWSLYTRADQLLYDAKCAGRNRTRRDTLDWFVPQVADEASAAA